MCRFCLYKDRSDFGRLLIQRKEATCFCQQRGYFSSIRSHWPISFSEFVLSEFHRKDLFFPPTRISIDRPPPSFCQLVPSFSELRSFVQLFHVPRTDRFRFALEQLAINKYRSFFAKRVNSFTALYPFLTRIEFRIDDQDESRLFLYSLSPIV